MDQQFQTSFIPKKPLTEERVATPTRVASASVNIFTFLATIIFFASLISAAGVYLYKLSLTKSVASAKTSLERARSAFEPTLIANMQKLDKRLISSNELLGSHLSLSPVFKSLQDLTLKSVRFTKFSYAITKDGGTKIEIKMSGQTSPAGGYTSIALQSDKLGENKYIRDPIFTNLVLNDKGGVNFDLTFSVDPTFVSYGENLKNMPENFSTNQVY
jgi:hypothetical protein